MVVYLAVLRAGHVALVTNDRADDITARYRPDLSFDSSGQITAGPGTAASHVLHPDLAVLLSTSGSTGSPKLVRLSRQNVLSNAAAIVSALSIAPDDRAMTVLPLHYCFGLSVLHSQLWAGGSVVLSTRGAAEPTIGELLVRHRVTIVPATPYVVDLFEVQGVLHQHLPDLRLIAQAGGALPPERVATIAALGRTQGWSLAVMYGQTEATARMAVLPPELVSQHGDAVGWPVAGSSFRLDTAVPEATTGPQPVGELLFSGPGVMMGYAEHPDDLALGRMVQELRTGDLARIGTDGLVRIVGRRTDSVKIAGLRIDLGRVERQLHEKGVPACVTASGDQLHVTYEKHACVSDPDMRRYASDLAGIGPSLISVHELAALPRLSNGKVDRVVCAAQHRPRPDRSERRGHAPDLAGVTAVLAPLTGHTDLDPDRSFVELGGDSFSHVQATIRLGRLLGKLPVDWHHRPLRELPQLARRAPVRRLGQNVETSVLLRAAAVIMICGSHVQLFPLAGGAHILLALAGFSYGRYVASAAVSAERWRRTARAALGIAVPSVVVAAAMLVGFRGAHWSNIVLLHWAVRPGTGNIFWFVEALLLTLLVVTALLSARPIATAYGRDPWRVAFMLTLALLIPRYLVLALDEGPVRGLAWTVAWLFTAGIALSVAQTTPRRLTTASCGRRGDDRFLPCGGAQPGHLRRTLRARPAARGRGAATSGPPDRGARRSVLAHLSDPVSVVRLLPPPSPEVRHSAGGRSAVLVGQRRAAPPPPAPRPPGRRAAAAPDRATPPTKGPVVRRRTFLTALGAASTWGLVGCRSSADAPAAQGYVPDPGALQVYSSQHQNVSRAWADAFTAATGVAVQVRQGQDASMGHQIVAEGTSSPADVFLTENSPAMTLVERAGLLAPVDDATRRQVPATAAPSSGSWTGIAARSTVLVYNTTALTEQDLPASLMDLSAPSWRDRWACAAGGADFQSIVAGMLAGEGEAPTSSWLTGLKANARILQNNIATMKAVNAGEVPCGVIFHYYWYRDQAATKEGSGNTALHYFRQQDPGAFVSLSGGGVLASATKADQAQQFLAFVTGNDGQRVLVDSGSMEYAVGKGVSSDPALPALRSLEAPRVDPFALDAEKVITMMTDTGIL